ncbi:MAG: hypothetical protein J6L83_08930 [Clostridia bacterium]|nr:hypothetical protein [Clostridia bacterium]
MVIDSKHTTVAYRCPECGAGVTSVVGLFSLSADMIKLKCTCKESDMQIVYRRDDNQMRLSIPCIFCRKPHTYNVSSKMFFSKDIFLLPCPYSDINIGFVGDENMVKAELARTELELLDMLEENGISDFKSLHGDEEDLPDSQVLDIVSYVIGDLDAEGKIYCKCYPEGREPLPDDELVRDDSEYTVEVTNEGIEVSCAKCGAKKIIPTDSMLTAHAFLNSDFLKLE